MKPKYKESMTKVRNNHLEKLPPQNLEAERCVLGAMILDERIISSVIEVLPDENSFYSEIHRVIYRAILDLYYNNKPVDIVILKDKLHKMDKLKNVGGAVYLADLIASVPSLRLISCYANAVSEKKTLRDLLQASDTLAGLVYDGGNEADSIIEKAQNVMSNIVRGKTNGKEESVSIGEMAENFNRVLNEEKEEEFPFRFGPLRKRAGGLDRGMLTVIGGFTSQSKSTLAIQLADEFAREGFRTVFCSSEMTPFQIVERIMCRRCHIQSGSLRNFRLAENREKVLRELPEMMKLPFWVSKVYTVADVRRAVRKAEADLVFVDHIHQMGEEGRSEYEIVSNIIVGLKNLAMEENVAVVAVSQLHRPLGDGLRPPRLSDFRSSGRIEENAQLVILLYWPYQFLSNGAKIEGKKAEKSDVLLTIAKQTAGPVGREKIYFMPEFYELAERYEP